MPRIYYSNVNFVPAARRDIFTDTGRSTFLYGASTLRSTAEACGAGGIEITPVRSAHYIQLTALRGVGARVLADTAVILHSGWRGIRDPKPANAGNWTRPTEETKDPKWQHYATKAMFPHGLKGMERLNKSLRALGNSPLGHIIYADEFGDPEADRAKSRQFSNTMIEPNADVYAAYDVKTPEELVGALNKRGLAASWDSFNSTRRAKFSDVGANHDYLSALLENNMVNNVRVSVFRNDFHLVDPDRVERSITEGNALIYGDELPSSADGNNLATTFKILREYRWQGDVTIAAPFANDIHAGAQRDGMIDRFQQLTEGVKHHMSWIPADAWQPMSGSAT